MYTLNKYGERIPPCRTPLETRKEDDIELPHLTHIGCSTDWLVCIPVTQESHYLSRDTTLHQLLKENGVLHSIKCFRCVNKTHKQATIQASILINNLLQNIQVSVPSDCLKPNCLRQVSSNPDTIFYSIE